MILNRLYLQWNHLNGLTDEVELNFRGQGDESQICVSGFCSTPVNSSISHAHITDAHCKNSLFISLRWTTHLCHFRWADVLTDVIIILFTEMNFMFLWDLTADVNFTKISSFSHNHWIFYIYKPRQVYIKMRKITLYTHKIQYLRFLTVFDAQLKFSEALSIARYFHSTPVCSCICSFQLSKKHHQDSCSGVVI